MACRSRFSHGSAATFDLCTALVPSAAAPTALVAVFATAKPWQPGQPEQLGLPQNAETEQTSAANMHSFILSSAALWIWLLKINKNDARSAAFSVPSTSRFFSAGSLIRATNSTRVRVGPH